MSTVLWLLQQFSLLIAAAFLLWVFFLAVMHLRDARDDGKLVGFIKYPAYLVLAIGLVFDAFVQFTLAVILWRELPPLQDRFPFFEATVSGRVMRWCAAPVDSFNRRLAFGLSHVWLRPFDKSGGHGTYNADGS